MKKTLLNLLIFLLIFALTACTVPNEPTGGGSGGGIQEKIIQPLVFSSWLRNRFRPGQQSGAFGYSNASLCPTASR